MTTALLSTVATDEDVPVIGSRNHAYVQANLIVALDKLNRFAVYSELSLEIDSQEYRPDVCAYPAAFAVESFFEDALRMTEMPLLAIEILSPKQFTQTITDKFKVYFKAGIPSCWMVIPNAKTVLVYATLEAITPFSQGELVDAVLDIRLPLNMIFREKHH